MPAMTRTVRAARLVTHGERLVVEPVTLPPPGPAQVVVDMAFAGVNPIDRWNALGRVASDVALPRTLGVEGVGQLDGRWVAVRGQGLWAEAAVVDAADVTDVPEGVAPEQAAAVGVAGVTAYRTVADLARVAPEDRVLVLGASGGVGSMVVSLARTIGATVWGQTGDPAKTRRITELGAQRAVVAADGEELAAVAEPLRPTAVFDALGDGFTGAAVQVMAEHGRLVLFGTSAGTEGRLPLQMIYRKGLSLLGYGGLIEDRHVRRRAVAAALAAVADGRMVVPVDAVLPLEAVNEALERLAERRVDGKLVVDLRAR